MNNTLGNIETKLDELLVRNAPALPPGFKKALVAWAPLLSLIVGVLTLASAWRLWHWARAAHSVVADLCNAYSVSGCGNAVAGTRYSVWLWLSVLFLAIQGLLYLLAYSGLRDRKKDGWDYVFYAALISVAYAVASLFTGYGVANVVGSLIGSVIGFYLLFQIREAYLGKKRVTPGDPPKDEPKQ